jgi:hypothetical protein
MRVNAYYHSVSNRSLFLSSRHGTPGTGDSFEDTCLAWGRLHIANWCWALQTARRDRQRGTCPLPAPTRSLGPTRTTRAGTQDASPRASPADTMTPVRRRRRSGPPPGAARAPRSVGHVTAQTGPGWARLPYRRAVTDSRSCSGRGPSCRS